ncbi:cation:proton antiporter [Candidatus Woesearchaeota archaeon]|nr:cation:proton antiporter [Candidatus Woesearchaeota archaeon]
MIENILLILLLLIITAKLLGGFFDKIGLEATLGELLAGLIFGPSILNWIHAESIEPFAIIGSVLILFVAGLKQEHIEEIYENTHALRLGIGLLILLMIIMSFFFYHIPQYFGINFDATQAIVLGLAFAIIDVGVPAKVLLSKKLMDGPVGKMTISSAIINIVLGLSFFTVITLFMNPLLEATILKVGGFLLFLGVAFGLVYFLSKITKFVLKMHIEESEFSLALVLVLALAYFTEVIGFSSVLGAFIAGVLVAKMPFADTRSFTDKIKSVSFGLFIPLFFVWFGLEIDLVEIWNNLGLSVLIFLTYASIRFISTYIYLRKVGLKMSGIISSSMLCVDVESLVILMIAIQLGIFTTNLPLILFAPSVFLGTFFIISLIGIFSKFEIKKKKVKAQIGF